MTTNKWLSIYFYYEGILDDLLSNLISPLVNESYQIHIEHFFFIKYYEGGPHIRLRIKVELSKLETVIKPLIDSYLAKFLIKTRPLYEVTIKYEDYKPELVRYGGRIGVNFAEKIFQLSSIEVLKLSNNRQLNYQMALGAALQLQLIFIINFFCDLKEALAFLNYGKNIWHYNFLLITKGEINNEDILFGEKNMKRLYSNQEPQIKELLEKTLESLKVKKRFDQPHLLNWHIELKKKYRYFLKRGDEMIKKSGIASQNKVSVCAKWGLIDSYMHMTNNRLGIHNKDEAYLYYILKRFFMDTNVIDWSINSKDIDSSLTEI